MRPLLLIGAAKNRTCILLFVGCCSCCIHSLYSSRSHHSCCLRGRIEAHRRGLQESLGFADGHTHYTSSRIICWARLGGARRESRSRVLALTQNLSQKNPTNISNYTQMVRKFEETYCFLIIFVIVLRL